MIDDVFEEGNVGFDAANAEFAQRAVHALASFGKLGAPRCDFYEQRVVVGREHRAGVRRAAVETNAKSCGRSVGRELCRSRARNFFRDLRW